MKCKRKGCGHRIKEGRLGSDKGYCSGLCATLDSAAWKQTQAEREAQRRAAAKARKANLAKARKAKARVRA